MLLNLKQYHRPRSVPEVLALLQKNEKGSVALIAGGTHVVPSNSTRIRELVDINRLGLNFIRAERAYLAIGATVTLQELIENSKVTAAAYKILAEACQFTSASRMVRNVSSIGGELARASSYSDIATCLLALDAELEIAAPDNRTFNIPISTFLSDGPERVLQGSILIQVRLPKRGGHGGTSFIRLSQIASSPTIMSVATRLDIQDRICKRARIAVGVAGVRPLRLPAIESLLESSTLNQAQIESVSGRVPQSIDPPSDQRASSKYRKTVSAVLLKRSLLESLREAENENLGK